MKGCSIIFFSTAVITAAQVSSVIVKPVPPAVTTSNSAGFTTENAKRTAAAGLPIAGYVLGPGPSDLNLIVLRSTTLQLDGTVTAPENTKRLYLPPRQQYALVERASEDSLALWRVGRASASALPLANISGSVAHPNLVVFSPRGDSLVLYSQAVNSLQIVSNLPAQPSLMRTISLPNAQTPALIAVSDDAALVVIEFADGTSLFSSNGAGWQPLTLSFTPTAWSFVPRTHQLVISDTEQKTIALISDLESQSAICRVLAQNVPADHLALTKSGQELVAVNFSSQQLWTIDLGTQTVTPNTVTGAIDTLSTLRDGFTFLLSNSPQLYLLKLGASPDLQSPVANPVPTGPSPTVIDLGDRLPK